MPTPPTSPVHQYRDLAARLQAVADAVTTWDAPSPCDGWSAADVVDHVVSTQRDFLSGHDITVGAARTPDDPAQDWQLHSDFVAGLLADADVARRGFDGFFGPATIGDTMATFYGFDMVVHRWDLATAAGLTTTMTDDELDLVASSIDGFGEHMYAEGICRPAVDAGPRAPRQDRLLALTGRDPQVTPVDGS